MDRYGGQKPRQLTKMDKIISGMRFKLGTAMMGRCLLWPLLGEEISCFWYDEFDADLGQPTGPAQEPGKYCKKIALGGDCPNYCPMVRFFEKGAVIINPSGMM